MLINFRKQTLYCALILLCIVLSSISNVQAQIIWENPKLPINSFLSRQAQKGNIEITDFILPMSRKEIALNLSALKDSIHKLSSIEKQELSYYMQEYSEFNTERVDSTIFFKKDAYKRWRAFSVDQGDLKIRLEPTLGMETTQGEGKNIFTIRNGWQLWGHINKNITFQTFFTDVTERGTRIDTIKQFSNETGNVRFENVRKDARLMTYSNLRASVA